MRPAVSFMGRAARRGGSGRQGAGAAGSGRIAIANPRLAPYGAAAVEAMTQLGLLDKLAPRFVQGENIGQTFQFVSTGNAPLGFVALSQVMVDGRISKALPGSARAPAHPLRQDAVNPERRQEQSRGRPSGGLPARRHGTGHHSQLRLRFFDNFRHARFQPRRPASHLAHAQARGPHNPRAVADRHAACVVAGAQAHAMERGGGRDRRTASCPAAHCPGFLLARVAWP